MLIAARNAMMVGKRGPTAKDYHQDGLYIHLDGLENIAYGVRSTNTPWYDLKGHGSASLDRNDRWTDWGTTSTGNGGYSINDLPTWFSNGMTIECLARQRVDTLENLCGFGASEQFILCPQPQYTRVFYVWNTLAVIDSRIKNGGTDAFLFTAVIKPGGKMDCYIDGVLKASDKAAGNTPTDNIIYIARSYRSYGSSWEKMNYRIYSKSLTAAEIAANYAVDKARFNLPG